MTQITNKGGLTKTLTDTSPEEIKTLTRETYTSYKKDIISQYKGFSSSLTKELYYYPLSDYIERLEYELKVIKEMGFNTYMLVVSDFTNWAKNNSIMVGPGRGSGAGSLLAYLVSITDINPFAYDLLFERFLNPARISMPDFDIDFEDTLREKVVQYVTDKYGHDNVCAIGTYMKLATKAAFKDAARAIGIPFEKSNQVSNLLGEIKSLKLFQTEDNDNQINEELKILYQQDKYVKNAIDQGGELEGNLRQLGVHACGVIISPVSVIEHTPTQIITKGKEKTLVSQFDGPTLEYIGLLKMDFLGLRNLSVIKNCIRIIQAKYHNTDLTIPEHVGTLTQYQSDKNLFEEFLSTMSFNPKLDDDKVFEQVFAKGNTTGIFQFEGEGIRRFLIDLKPNHINDLVAMNALYRPGPLEFIPTYIRRKHGEEPVEYMLPELVEILRDLYQDEELIKIEKEKLETDLGPIMGLTYGIAVYQEQLMFLVQSMAGFSLPEADLLRRGIGKKKKEVIEQLKIEFVTRAESFRGYKAETAKFIYEKMIEPAASYSFNKSHAVCYAHIAYQTGYLKAHYPIEFYAALLRSVEEDTDKLGLFIEEVKEHQIPVYKPDINRSYNHISAIDDGVMIGFFACKGIGFDIGETIEQERKRNGLFQSLEDFLSRCSQVINKKSLESLIKAGAFDKRHNRNTLLTYIDILLDRHKKTEMMEGGLFGGTLEVQSLEFPTIIPTSIVDTCKYDVEIFKTMISGHPLDGLYLYCKKYGFIQQYKERIEPGNFSIVAMIKKITRAKKKGFFIMVEDVTDSFEFFVKELLDLKIYDVLAISGYKSRSRSIDTMIKLSLEDFIQQAKKSGKFDPKWTVTQVRAGRKKEIQETILVHNDEVQENQTQDKDSLIIGSITNESSKKMEENIVSTANHINNKPLYFPLPDSLQKINMLLTIIKTYTGDKHTIMIGEKEYHLSEEGLRIIQELQK